MSLSPSLHIPLCFIHHLCEVEPNLQAQRASLATAPLRAGLINYPPRQPDGIAGAHRMTDPEPCGQPGAACSGPLSLSLTPFLFYSTRVSVRYDPQSDTSEPVTEQSLLEKACWQYQHQHFGRDAVIIWCGPNAPDLKVGSNSRCED